MNDEEFAEVHHTLGILVSDYVAKLSVAVHQLKTLPFLGREQLRMWILVVGGVTRRVQTETGLFQADVERTLAGISSDVEGVSQNDSDENSTLADLLVGIKREPPKCDGVAGCIPKNEGQLAVEAGVHDSAAADNEIAATIKTAAFDLDEFLNGLTPETEVVDERNASDESVAGIKVEVQSNVVVFGEDRSICSDDLKDSSSEGFRGFPSQPASEDDYVLKILRRITDTETELSPTTKSECIRTVESHSEVDVQSMLGERRVLRCYLDRMNRVQIEKWTSNRGRRRRRSKGVRRRWSRK